jgi:uncharacterized protein (DUF302 family)
VKQRWVRRVAAACTTVLLATALAGCGTWRTAQQLEDGAGAEAGRLWDRWVEADGDLAASITWSRKVRPGVTPEMIEQAFASVAVEQNLRAVGELPLSRELEARSGQPQRLLKVYSYCNPQTARAMVDFSPALSAFLPCRVTVVERDDGLWLYTLNMDLMIHMGRKLPLALKADALRVREAIWLMLERGASGEF